MYIHGAENERKIRIVNSLELTKTIYTHTLEPKSSRVWVLSFVLQIVDVTKKNLLLFISNGDVHPLQSQINWFDISEHDMSNIN